MSNKEETKEETKEQEKPSTFSFTQKHLKVSDVLAIGDYTPPKTAQELYIWLQAAMSIELSTLPLYCQAWFSITSQKLDAYGYFRHIIMQEMLHMSIVSNVTLSIFGGGTTYPVVCAFNIDYSEGVLPQMVRPDLHIALNRYSVEQLILFAQIECVAPLATPYTAGDPNPFAPGDDNKAVVSFIANSEVDTIGKFYEALIEGITTLYKTNAITFGNGDELQVAHLKSENYPGYNITEITTFEEAINLLEMIIIQGEGHGIKDWISGQTYSTDEEKPHFIKFVELSVGKKIQSVSGKIDTNTGNINVTFVYSSDATLTVDENNIQPQSNFETADNSIMEPVYTTMLRNLQTTLNDPEAIVNGNKGGGIPGTMFSLLSAFNSTMQTSKYPTWAAPDLNPPPSVFDISRKARILFLKAKLGHNFYKQNIRIQKAGTKAVNGVYKNTSYELLPAAIRKQDTTAKRNTGIIGYQHIFSGSGTEYYVTVSAATTKDVTTTSPTLSIYELNLKDQKVTLLYTAVSKHGVLPDPTNFTYKSNEKGDKKSNPRVILHINQYIEPSKLVNAFSGVWYGEKGIDTMFIMNQEDPINGPLGGDINKGFATSYNETVEYVPLSFGVLNPKTLSLKNPGGDPETGEVIYGVRLVRRVVSTLPDNNKTKNNPFKSGGTIHEETGYILFCYVGGILVRIAKSLAIPRVISVLANDDTPIVTYLNGNLVIRTSLKAKAASKENLIWTVSNGAFPDHYGKVTEFEQIVNLTYDEKNPNESSLMYLQWTPVQFQNKITPHTNKNFLTKQS